MLWFLLPRNPVWGSVLDYINMDVPVRVCVLKTSSLPVYCTVKSLKDISLPAIAVGS